MDVFDLVAKIRLDSTEYESGVGKAKSTFSTLASGVGKGLATVAKVGAAAVTAAATGIAALTKMGIEGYAQYEQLVGGVETLFKESQGTVMKYAENAYKTAGMSANAYMETVTSFSASLIQSLDGDTAKAAEVGNMAITDMSDNANKMGTSIGMIQNAYQGFAKQNYTMLDNLKLGYGGTKEEMQRLINDANKVKAANGEMADLSIDSFADVTEAIHIIQTEMGITGTTAKEAASTIEGSIAMMKGAWQNLVVGMADENADIGALMDDFVESAATAASNLIPRISQTLAGIGQLIGELAPVIEEAFPMLVEEVLPVLLESAISLCKSIVTAVVEALPEVGMALLDAVTLLLTDVFGIPAEKAEEFRSGVIGVFTQIGEAFNQMVVDAQTEGTWLNEVWTGLQETGKLLGEFLSAAFEALSAAFAWCVEQVNTDGTLLNTIWENIQTVISGAIEYIQGCITLFTAILQGDWETAWGAVKDIAQTVWDTICGVWGNIGAWFDEHVVQPVYDAVVQPIVDYFTNLWNSLVSIWDWICGTVESAFSFIVSIVKFAFDLITLPFRFIWENCKEAVFSAFEWIKDKIAVASEWISEKVAVVWGWIRDNIVKPVQDAYQKAIDIFKNIKTGISDKITEVKDNVTKTFKTIKEKIQKPIEEAKTSVSDTLDGIKKKFSTIWDGCKKIVTDAVDALKKALNFKWSLPELKMPHITVTGGVAPYGIGGKGSLPSFNIEWYKKAYDNAMILSSPTIFGYSGGKLLGGGDGNGNEVVAGESHLMNMIGSVVESKIAGQNERIASLLSAMLEATVDGNEELRKAVLAGHVIELNGREVSRMVRTYA